MEAREIRGMPPAELKRRLDEAHQELFNLRFQMVTGQLKDTNRLTEVRQDIARLKTVLREREMAKEGSPS